MSWLISSMTPVINENFLLYTMTKDILDAACETFSSKDNTAEIFHVESLLHDIHQWDNSVTIYFTTLQCYWQQLDLFELHEWKCPDGNVYFKKVVKTKRIFKILMGLDKSLDELRCQILGTKPLSSLREVFSKVHQEENQKRVMMGRPA